MSENLMYKPPEDGERCASQCGIATQETRRPLNLTPEMLEKIRQSAPAKTPKCFSAPFNIPPQHATPCAEFLSWFSDFEPYDSASSAAPRNWVLADKRRHRYGVFCMAFSNAGCDAWFASGVNPGTGRILYEFLQDGYPMEAYASIAETMKSRESSGYMAPADLWYERLDYFENIRYQYSNENIGSLEDILSISSRLRMLQSMLNHLFPQVYQHQPLTIEMPMHIPGEVPLPRQEVDPYVRVCNLEAIKNVIKAWMWEHFEELEEREQLAKQMIMKSHMLLMEYLPIWDGLLKRPVPEDDYSKALEKFHNISESWYRERERTAGIYLLLLHETPIVNLITTPNPQLYETTDRKIIPLPNSLAFQWMDEIRREKQGVQARGVEESKPLTSLSNRPVWMRAVKDCLDDPFGAFAAFEETESRDNICDFCAGPCGDCPERWSDDPHACDSCVRDPECAHCPLHPDRLMRDIGPDELYDDLRKFFTPLYTPPPPPYPPLPHGSFESPNDDDEYFWYLREAPEEDDD